MVRRVDDMAPVEKGCYPGIDLIECSDEIAYICILWRIKPHSFPDQYAEILVERPIRSNSAQRRLPKVDMPIDEARHGNHATAVNFSNRPTSYIAAHSNDLVAINQQIARLNNSECGIH